MLRMIVATRSAEQDFLKNTALGMSLQRLAFDRRLVARIAFSNKRGLPEIYNPSILKAAPDDILVFVHDDVWLDDYFLVDRIEEGLQKFDVIGLAGNRRKVPGQPAWAFIDAKFTWDDKTHLSGSVAHGKNPFGAVSHFGPAGQECELLDGVFLAARASALQEKGVLFDPRFDFHFYDMDFCRTARKQGLRLGTWPICLTHQSGGAFGSPGWQQKYQAYLEKWGN